MPLNSEKKPRRGGQEADSVAFWIFSQPTGLFDFPITREVSPGTSEKGRR